MCVCVVTNVYACDIRDVIKNDMPGAKPNADKKSAQLYALRDGLSQISWLVLEDHAKLHIQRLSGGEGAEERNREILREIQIWMSKRYNGGYTVGNAYKCFYVLSHDMHNFANTTRGSSDWEEDTWGITFLELLDGFNKILEDANFATSFLPSARYTERFDAYWTIMCTECVWVTTQFHNAKLGDLDTLYAECISQQEVCSRVRWMINTTYTIGGMTKIRPQLRQRAPRRLRRNQSSKNMSDIISTRNRIDTSQQCPVT
jgi:hypothetical protein